MLATTDLVVAELHGLTLGRMGPAVALQVVDGILRSVRVEVVATGPDMLRASADFLRSRPGRRLSLVDATSFLVMRARGIGVALSLDDDFAAEGFRLLP